MVLIRISIISKTKRFQVKTKHVYALGIEYIYIYIYISLHVYDMFFGVILLKTQFVINK